MMENGFDEGLALGLQPSVRADVNEKMSLLQGRGFKMGGLFVITVVIALPIAFVLAIVSGSDSLASAIGCLGVAALMVALYFVVVGGGLSLFLHSCSA